MPKNNSNKINWLTILAVAALVLTCGCNDLYMQTFTSISLLPSSNLRLETDTVDNVASVGVQASLLTPREINGDDGHHTSTVVGNNIHYNFPYGKASLDVFRNWKWFSLFAQGDVSMREEQWYYGGMGGIGLHFRSDNLGFRLDHSAGLYKSQYYAELLSSSGGGGSGLMKRQNAPMQSATSADSTTKIFQDSHILPAYSIALTCNTLKKQWPVNFFCRMEWTRLSLFEQSDNNGSAYADMVLLSIFPGVYASYKDLVFTAGVNVSWETSLQNAMSTPVFEGNVGIRKNFVPGDKPL